MVEYIDKVTDTHNVYFCVNVLSVPKRRKDNAIPQNLVWADLDACAPKNLEIPPQCVIESSPARYQALWRLEEKIDPYIAENFGKRLAYHHADLGADKSGHDITQLLRVPGTYNFKYELDEAPRVHLVSSVEELLPVSVFEAMPELDEFSDVPEIAVPELQDLPTPDMILHRHLEKIKGSSFPRYYSEEPGGDWSKVLWRLINMCLDMGMTAEETFVIAKNSKCNKYARDGRPDSHLWREVLKAELEHKTLEVLLSDHRQLVFPALLTAAEEGQLERTVIDDYMDWAVSATDAVPEFHEIGCAVAMSAVMSTTLRLHTSNATIFPNIWAMILGESTLTRKSTAMDMAMDLINEVNNNLLLASDATAEGLLSNLSLRPKQVSIFYRDEVTGFFDAINHKSYLASMPEIMTKLYDVPKYMTRALRKETFIVSEPIFIFFGGGVPDKMYSLIEESYYASGFIPRFLIMRGYPDADRIRPTGPPRADNTQKRFDLAQTFMYWNSIYTDNQVSVTLSDGTSMTTTAEIEVLLKDEVWQRAGEMERQLINAAIDSPEAAKASPVFSRMFTSLLKLTMLFAAARQEPTNFRVTGEMRDLLNAAYYIQRWGVHAVDLIVNSGGTSDETKLRTIYRTIERHPGILRSALMQRHRLNSREMQILEETLAQRMMIDVVPKGTRGKQYWPIGV